MSSQEFTEWVAYYELNPFGPYRGDIHAGIVASTIANANAPKGKRFQVKDFLPEFQPRTAPARAMSGEQVLAYFQALQAAQKGRR